MPIIKSAKKAVRQSLTRRLRNKSKKSLLAKELALIKKGNKKEFALLYSLADKAAKAGVIHHKKAARLKRKVAKLKQK